jgi:hypothetical protein
VQPNIAKNLIPDRIS